MNRLYIIQCICTLPQMEAWSTLTLGYINNWNNGVKAPFCIITSVKGNDTSSALVNISDNGEVYVKTHDSAITYSNAWFHGFSTIVI